MNPVLKYCKKFFSYFFRTALYISIWFILISSVLLLMVPFTKVKKPQKKEKKKKSELKNGNIMQSNGKLFITNSNNEKNILKRNIKSESSRLINKDKEVNIQNNKKIYVYNCFKTNKASENIIHTDGINYINKNLFSIYNYSKTNNTSGLLIHEKCINFLNNALKLIIILLLNCLIPIVKQIIRKMNIFHNLFFF